MKVFLDTNIYYSAFRSKKGASYILLQLARFGLFKLYVSQFVLYETKIKFQEKESEEQYFNLLHFFDETDHSVVKIPILPSLQRFGLIMKDPNDVLILAAAEQAHVDYLVTLDKKHFFTQKVKKAISAQIVSPGELLEVIRSKIKE